MIEWILSFEKTASEDSFWLSLEIDFGSILVPGITRNFEEIMTLNVGQF